MENANDHQNNRMIRVNLTNGNISEEIVSEKTLYENLGGTSLGVKMMYEEVDPKIEWSSPENKFYILSGPVGGVKIPGSACTSIVTKGTHTNGIASSQFNGFFGAYLKSNDILGLAVEGCSNDWKYILIDEGKIYVKSANHLIGLDTWDTEERIKNDLNLGQRKLSTISIGPAGENLVMFSGAFGSKGHAAAHNGTGAVLGSKKIKAVAVIEGKKKVKIFDKNEFNRLRKEFIKDFQTKAQKEIYEFGTSRQIPPHAKGGFLPVKNYTTNLFPEAENFVFRDKLELKRVPCFGCPSSCHVHVTIKDGPFSGFIGKEPEYEQYAAFGPLIGITDPAETIVLANFVDRTGLDCNETGWIVAWLMECYENDLITKEKLDGIEMEWGNFHSTQKIIEKIAKREGVGDILAEGIKAASEKFGDDAQSRAIYTEKGNIPRTHDHRVKCWEFLDTIISESGTLQTQLAFLNLEPFGLENSYNGHSYDEVAKVIGKTSGSLTFVDSLVFCWFPCSGNISILTKILNAVTGWDYDFDKGLAVGRRTINRMRVYNFKAGLSPELEKPSKKYGSVPKDGPGKDLNISEKLDEMKRIYYALMGWDPQTGLPTKETLENLGLNEIVKDI